MENVLSVKGLSKNFGKFSLADVSFDVPKGYVTGLIGPNGAGKTTVIKTVLGAVNSDGGGDNDFRQGFARFFDKRENGDNIR